MPGVAPRPPPRSRRAEGHKGLLPLVLARAGAGDGPLPRPPDESGDGLDSLRLPVAARLLLCLFVVMDLPQN